MRGVSFFDLDEEGQTGELARWENFWGKFKKPHDRIYMKQAHNWGNQLELQDRLQTESSGSYGDVYHPCILPWSTMHITAMGIVALCPQDYDGTMNLGDINKDTIVDVWRGEKWTAVRKLHESGQRNDIEFCRGCKLFDLDFSIEKKAESELTM